MGEEKDGSLYMGNYLSSKQYKKGSFVKPSKGKVHVSYSEGEFVDLNRNTKMKISFHPSGQTHAKTQDRYGEYLWMMKREELYKFKGCKELGFFLPMETINYPIMEKSIDKADVVLPLTQFDHKPYVIDLYLAEKSFDPTILLSPKKGRGILCVWEGMLRLILCAYQTEDTRQKGVYPPNEYWVFKKKTS